ncbi:hypothetical protein COC69_33395 [Bacillus cereus]|uniref:Small, acid-soluble spore protein, alpha/beta type n=1 Tax=Bacillus cereus TaxID=1396 RepID=A0A9X7CGM3_BACCE|nr:alpha/beta-type small acid-soluble spore protein [Bacillus cereus]PGS59415.1 hypothetical protein COC69_33395 [Bacillus cereus]
MNIRTDSNSETWISWMKDDVAREFGVKLGAEATARANGSVGGEITKRLVAMSLQQLSGVTSIHPNSRKIKH